MSRINFYASNYLTLMPLRSFLLHGYWGTHRSSLGPNQRVHKTGWCSFVAAPFSQVWYLWAKFISDFWNNTAQAILLNENWYVWQVSCYAWRDQKSEQFKECSIQYFLQTLNYNVETGQLTFKKRKACWECSSSSSSSASTSLLFR